MGIPVYTKTTDEDGNPVLMDEEGNVTPLDPEEGEQNDRV
jgi:hypothetical protein